MRLPALEIGSLLGFASAEKFSLSSSRQAFLLLVMLLDDLPTAWLEVIELFTLFCRSVISTCYMTAISLLTFFTALVLFTTLIIIVILLYCIPTATLVTVIPIVTTLYVQPTVPIPGRVYIG